MRVPQTIEVDLRRSGKEIIDFILNLPSIGFFDNQVALEAIRELAAPKPEWDSFFPKFISFDRDDFWGITVVDEIKINGQSIKQDGFMGFVKMNVFIRGVRSVLLDYQFAINDADLDEVVRKQKQDECNQIRFVLDILDRIFAQALIHITATYRPVDIFSIVDIKYQSEPPHVVPPLH